MTDRPWYAQRRHFRDLRDRLTQEGVEVLDAWMGRHLRLRVRASGKEGIVTCAISPAVAEHAVNGTVQQARRIGTRP